MKLPRATQRRRTPTVFQHEAAECGIACLAMILGFYGRWVQLEELRAVAGVNRDGTKASNLLKTAARYDLEGGGFTATVEELAQAQLPVIIFWNFNHFIVVDQITGDTAWVNDPATGPRTITLRELDEGFTGVMLSFTPGLGFRRGGEKPSLLRGIQSYVASYEKPIAAAVLAGFLLIVPGLLVPGIQRAFIDHYLIGGLSHWLTWLISAIVGVAALRGLIVFLQQRTLARFQARLGVSVSGRFLWQLLHLPISFFAQRNSGDLAGRLMLGDRLTGLLSGSLATAVIGLLAMAVYAVVMVTYDVKLTALILLFAALNLALLLWLTRRLSDAHRRMLQDEARMQAMTLQGLANIDNYRASGTETVFFRRWAGAHARVVNGEQAMAFWQRLLSNLPVMLTAIAGVCIVLFGGVRVMEGTLSIGMLIALQTLMANFNAPVTSVIGLSGQLQQARGYVDRLGDVLEEEPDEEVPGITYVVSVVVPVGELDLRDVNFGYARVNAPFLRAISLRAGPGERIAVTGPSGSGKSTLGKVICGLLPATDGDVLIDHRPVAALPTAVLRSTVAYVDQTTTLFAGNVRDNITLWDPTIDEDRIVAAAKDAMVHEIISARPNAYETRVEDDGRNFSGGERQRLAIARALALDPALIVFDEATSGLDAVVEKAILDNIRRRGCTCILISHRLSVLRDCDEIVVLDNGRVVERGRHAELLAADRLYRRLIDL